MIRVSSAATIAGLSIISIPPGMIPAEMIAPTDAASLGKPRHHLVPERLAPLDREPVLASLQGLGEHPDVIHAHDWQTALSLQVDAGEIGAMKDVGLSPVFYGQALIGAGLPHLTYMLAAETREAHKEHFKAFGSHPVWQKLKNDPQYADTVSKITSRFLVPSGYSQI